MLIRKFLDSSKNEIFSPGSTTKSKKFELMTTILAGGKSI